MQSKKIKLSLIVTLGFFLTTLHAQEAILTSGGEATGSNGTISYSIGQVVYQTYTGSAGSVAEGVQQVFEIQEVTGMENVFEINLAISTFPNPVIDNLTLSVPYSEVSSLSYRLFNIQGVLLENKEIANMQTNIDMSRLMPGIYFLKVAKYQQDIKTFKIIKE